MVIRYSVEAVTLDSKHPLWPNAEGFKIRDNKTNEFGFGFYTTLEAALEMCDKKNNVL